MRKHHLDGGCSSPDVEHTLYSRTFANGEILAGTYTDEIFGGASTIEAALAYRDFLKLKYNITWHLDWDFVLGFGVDTSKPETIIFTTLKYIRSLQDRHLRGEGSSDRKSPARKSIMTLHEAAASLPEIGSPEDIAMRPMQDEARELCGGLGHLSRGRSDVTLEHALCAQYMQRPTYEMYEHLKETLRYAVANADLCHTHTGLNASFLQNITRIGGEPIRPYDDTICYGLYGVADAMHATPVVSDKHVAAPVAASKSLGCYAVMLGSAAVEWKTWRHHTMTVDIASGETLAGSRCAARLVYFGGVCQFLGMDMSVPPPLFTDNDGTWYVARDAQNATKMIYVVRHVRMLQDLVEKRLISVFQVDGRLNPVDALSKWLEAVHRAHHQMFLMGNARGAIQAWQNTTMYRTFKPKKLVPAPAATGSP